MPSITSDDSGCEVDDSEKISGDFVVADGDSPELFEFTEEIRDSPARLVEFPGQNREVCGGRLWAGQRPICRRLPP